MPNVTLQTPLSDVSFVRHTILAPLRRLGIRTIKDLLFYFPNRYDDFSRIKSIAEIIPDEVVTIQARVEKIIVRRTARMHATLTDAVLRDTTGAIHAVWFNQPFLARNLPQGSMVRISGKVVLRPRGLNFSSPAYEKIGLDAFENPVHTSRLVPIYPETRGISSRWLRFLLKKTLPLIAEIRESLPEDIRKKYDLPALQDAVMAVHFPETLESAETARRRFEFEELLVIQLRALQEKIKREKDASFAIPENIPLIQSFVDSLPFALTHAQKRSMWEIIQDMAKGHPMNRLLEGDVGSGKTVVAAAAALEVARAGFKAVFMAPTEILAVQHFDSFCRLLPQFGVTIGLLTGSQKKFSIHSDIIIGTHALIQKNIHFKKLGLVIVDEQHRFGVAQRAELTRQHNASGQAPHFLSMTATPIPRTLALTIYGDLDLSLLDELPKSRKPIFTKIVLPSKRAETYQFIEQEVKRGRQVFVICPRIDSPSETIVSDKTAQQTLLRADMKAVKEEYEKLSREIFPHLRIAMLHGKMKPKEKEKTMQGFKRGVYDILVSTSVVEVGVDVPNATVMMIEGAERFGLAQLHQFRGRVGRSMHQSHCFLLPTEGGVASSARLKALVESENGFALAEKDLALRGAGDFLGTRQWGVPDSISRALANGQLVRQIRAEAVELLSRDPALNAHPALQVRVKEAIQATHEE